MSLITHLMGQSKRLIAPLILLLLAAILGILYNYTNSLALAEESIPWVQFFGRFHPVVLHLPIGLFFGLFILELLALKIRNSGVSTCTYLLSYLVAFSACLASYLGLLLASNGEYQGETFELHKNLGILFAIVSLVTTALKQLSLCEKALFLWIYRSLMLAMLLLLSFVGHNGGNLTHGVDYLTHYAPDWLLQLNPLKSDKQGLAIKQVETSASKNDHFSTHIQPILNAYCVECHGADKQKSGYRLDTYDHLIQPGKMGDTPIKDHSLAESKLLEYMLLPESDMMAMPPEGKKRPSADEILKIAHWISLGAEGPPIDEVALAAELKSKAKEIALLEQLFGQGIILLPIASDSNLLYLDFQNHEGPLLDTSLEIISNYKDRIFEIKLTGSRNPYPIFEALSHAKLLESLNLSNITSADSIIQFINTFNQLKKLNLYGSDISEAGLAQLNAPKLHSLCLAATAITNTHASPHLAAVKVIPDFDLSELAQIEAVSDENTSTFKPQK